LHATWDRGSSGSARALQQVPGDRCHVAKLHRGAEQQRLADHGEPLADGGIGRQLLHRGQRHDPHRAAASADAAQRQAGDVDQAVGPEHAVLHQVQLRRPAG
jgi:hypothetical protein